MNHHPNSNLSRDQAMPQPLFGCRRPLFCLAMLFCLAGSGVAHAFEQPKVYDLKPKDQVMIIGDSTSTDAYDVAGYVRLVDQAINEQIPEMGVVVRASAGTFLKAFGLKPVWQKFQIRVSTARQGCAMRVGADNFSYGGGKIKLEPELPTQAPSVTSPGWTGNWPTEQPAYAPGTKVTLTFLPAAGWTFNRWFTLEERTLKETTPNLTITIDRHTWIWAEAKRIETKKP
ncbi:MAG: hypothetical protein WCI20_13185 [bacterium]